MQTSRCFTALEFNTGRPTHLKLALDMGVLSLLVSLFCGLVAAICMSYMFVFIDFDMYIGPSIKLILPQYSDYIYEVITINYKPKWNSFVIPFLHSMPVVNNILLLCLFGLQHSATQRGLLKKILGCCVSESYYRPVFVFASAVCLFSIFLLWIPIKMLLWDITHPQLKLLVCGLNALAWVGAVFSVLNLNPLKMVGIFDHIGNVLGWKKQDTHPVLVTSGLYGLMRHPCYSFFLLALWVTPKMTIGHSLFASFLTVYVVFAVAMYEEPALVKEFGQEYVEYMKKTPMYVPNLPWSTKHKKV